MKKTRLLAALLCLCMIIAMLPIATFAGDNKTHVWIQGIELLEATPYYHNGEEGNVGEVNNTEADANATYDSDSSTLTINLLNVNESIAMNKSTMNAIYADGDLTIRIEGINTISVAKNITTDEKAYSYGLFVEGSLTLKTGTNTIGSLTAITKGAEDTRSSRGGAQSFGVYVKDTINVESDAILKAEVKGTSKANTISSAGVVANTINVTGGTIKGISDSFPRTYYAAGDYASNYGILAHENLTITDGEVIGRGSNASPSIDPDTRDYINSSYGICASNINASGGMINGSSYDVSSRPPTSHGFTPKVRMVPVQQSVGIYAFSTGNENGTITVSGNSVVTGFSNEATRQSIGVLSDRRFTVTGGTLNAYGGFISIGSLLYPISSGVIVLENGFYMSGGKVTANASIANNQSTSGDSIGIMCSNTDGYGLSVSGGELNATGESAARSSCGVFSSNGDIKVSGGSFTAIGNDEASTPVALSRELKLGPGVKAKGSKEYVVDTPMNPVEYESKDNASYQWVSVSDDPALIVEVAPAESVAKGDTVTLTAATINISNPTYQWYSAIDKEAYPTTITGATAQTYNPPTDTVGTMFYYCATSGKHPRTDGISTVYSNIVAITVCAPTVTSVNVSPTTKSIVKGGSETFSATVTGEYKPAQTVRWTVEGGNTDTTIDSNGKLTISANETATTLTIKATSTVDTTVVGTATVTVTDPPAASATVAVPVTPTTSATETSTALPMTTPSATATAPAQIKYKIIKGRNGIWMRDSDGGLSFTANVDYNKFTGVLVDGSAITKDNYSSRSGSTIVKLKASYLETLSVGKHTIQIDFNDRYAGTNFTIEPSDDSEQSDKASKPDKNDKADNSNNQGLPATGDKSPLLLWLCIALIASALFAITRDIHRKQQQP